MWRHIAFVSGLSIHMSISQSVHHAFMSASYLLKVAGQRFMSAPYFIVLYTSTSPLISQADQIGPNKKNTCV